MAPGRHDTCPCGYVWTKHKDGEGYTCEGGHHTINGAGETPGEALWSKQRSSDKKKADGEVARQRDHERRRTGAREEQARKDKEIDDATTREKKDREIGREKQRDKERPREREREKMKEKERARRISASKQASPSIELETESARTRRKSREQEIQELRESRIEADTVVSEARRETKLDVKTSHRRSETSRGTKAPNVQSSVFQSLPSRTRQQRQTEEAKVDKRKGQRHQEDVDYEYASERSAAWSRINATHTAALSRPDPSTQPSRRPLALPAPEAPGRPVPTQQTTKKPRALPAPLPTPVVEPLPWMRAPPATPSRQREPELLPIRGSRTKAKEREKMPWE
ncbi:uncharacterized protein RSE6_12066 [Rhynchosporium secalis]|uniref:Uncharacterized protein n=1 Tax=Rhynchosporium secalis TaxID=38038 RepID=A0A1E1MQF6_RHYSE|nr:uncharacterized protein RSE6_12066 [Rhynchosporium secalis]